MGTVVAAAAGTKPSEAVGETRTLKERAEVLVASVMASPPISQVTLSNRFTCSNLSFLICHGGNIPCPAYLTDLSQRMGVCAPLRVELPPGGLD